MFSHEQIWAAFEVIAERCGMSLSALSKSAGLDPTSFNPSKRYGRGGRERWPSTETLSRVLKAANMDLREFAAILDSQVKSGSEQRQSTRRQSKRFATILEGRIRLDGQDLAIACRIRDLSAGGARIGLSETIDLPSEFELAIPRLGQVLKVRLIWSRGQSCGLMFLGELRPPPSDDGASLLDVLQVPDDETYQEIASERLASPPEAAPKKRTRRWQERLKQRPRKSH